MFIYIEEAHATDEWPVLSVNDRFPQHKSTADRVATAVTMLKEFPLSAKFMILLDNENNDFNQVYPSWPTRYWIINNGVLQVRLDAEGETVSLDALELWLQQYKQMQQY